MFDKIILPHSGTILDLMRYLLILTTVIYWLYAGLLFGSATLSVIFNILYKRNNNKAYKFLACNYSEFLTGNKVIIIGLGIVPLLSIVIFYSVILQDSGSEIPLFLLFSFCLFLIGVFLIYSYTKAIQNIEIFTSVLEQSPDARAEDRSEWLALKESYQNVSSKTGVWGIVFLFLSLWVYCTCYDMSIHINEQVTGISLFSSMFSLTCIIKFLHFLCSSFALIFIVYLISKYYSNKESIEIENTEFEFKFNAWGALILCSLQPVFYVLNLLTTPSELLSPGVFVIFLIAMILVFLLLHFLYNTIKEKKYGNIRYSCYLLLAVIVLLVIKEQIDFRVASEKQIYTLSLKYDKTEKEELEKAGLLTEKISGEDIYQSKCTACHLFDKRLTGPPHKLVMIKYENDHDAMIKFILNPVKIDPAYPAMPNQGLKPAEAKAVVDYMYEHFGKELQM